MHLILQILSLHKGLDPFTSAPWIEAQLVAVAPLAKPNFIHPGIRF